MLEHLGGCLDWSFCGFCVVVGFYLVGCSFCLVSVMGWVFSFSFHFGLVVLVLFCFFFFANSNTHLGPLNSY